MGEIGPFMVKKPLCLNLCLPDVLILGVLHKWKLNLVIYRIIYYKLKNIKNIF